MYNTIGVLTRRYGKPKAGIWENKVLTRWDIPEDINKAFPCLPNRLYCNKDIIKPLEAVFRELMQNFWAGRLSQLDSLVTFDGCFNIRLKTNGRSLSSHAWGISIDLNAFRNGYGKTPTFSERFVRIWEKHGFFWGGRWRIPDGMHFEYNVSLLN